LDVKEKLSVFIDAFAGAGEKRPPREGELNVLVVNVESSESDRLRFSCMVTAD
jgi:hypothetical protein